MHLLAALNSGHQAAALGTAQIYVRGSSTRATWYADLEASTADSSGVDINLDAYGSALVYVNQLVDVVILDADGSPVRSYGDGVASGNVEAITQSFAGVDYVTGATGVSKPTTLQSILDLWKTNSGATDWKVLLSGTALTLQVALGSLTGLVFNVKNPAYGAVGDGVTNDTAAISAAMAAAVAAGGGIVFFPAGTYRIISTIAWDYRVAIWGVGDSLVTISVDHASAGALVFSSGAPGSGSPILIRGVSFSSLQANSGTAIQVDIGLVAVIDQCTFCVGTNATGVGVALGATPGRALFRDCYFKIQGQVNGGVTMGSAWSTDFSGCHFLAFHTNFAGTFLQSYGRTTVTSTTFDRSSNTTGTAYAITQQNASDRLSIADCRFRSNVAGWSACLNLLATAYVNALGNDYENNTRYATTGVLGDGSRLEFRPHANVSSSTTPTIPDSTELISFVSTTTKPTFTMPTQLIKGQRFRVHYYNGSGGIWAAPGLLFSGGSVYSDTTGVPPQIGAGVSGFFEAVLSDHSVVGTYRWVVNFTAAAAPLA